MSSIILKNIKYNIQKYVAYLLGNSIIICTLFMFCNLIFSKSFMNEPKDSLLKDNLNYVFTLMVIFSVAFILYTTISFTKYRGKEFGVYFTIGLTSKNIIKILSYENIVISMSSFIFGGIAGTLFSKLFFMAILKVLHIKNLNVGIMPKSYAAIAVISVGIFTVSLLYQIIFLKKLSIMQILKSSSKKDSGKSNCILGILGLFVLAASMMIFKVIIEKDVDNDSLLAVLVIAAVIAEYFVIGFAITIVVGVSKLFKSFYNNNILVLNSLSHRFFAYRIVLYIVTLLVAGAMVFISITYAMYKATGKYIKTNYPYDLSFIVEKASDKENWKDIIKSAGGEIRSYNKLESINVFDLRTEKNEITPYGAQISIISEDNYNKLTNENIKIDNDYAYFIHRDKAGKIIKGGLLITYPKNHDEVVEKLFINSNKISFSDYEKVIGSGQYLYFPNEKKIDKAGSVSNYIDSADYFRSCSIVISNEDYNKLKVSSDESSICYDILVNLKNSDKSRDIQKNLVEKLKKIGGEKLQNSLVLKKSQYDQEMNNRGFSLFSFAFLGTLLLIGSGAVLYFKTFTSLEDDKTRSIQLINLGLTSKEINKTIIKELGAIFLVPPVIAITLVGYYLSSLYSMVPGGDYIWQNTLFVFCVYGIIQMVFYVLTTNRYLREVNS